MGEPWKGAWEGGGTGKGAKSRFYLVGMRTKDRLGTLRKTCSTCIFLLSPKSQPLSQLVRVIFVPVSRTSGIIWESVRNAEVQALSPDLLNQELWE